MNTKRNVYEVDEQALLNSIAKKNFANGFLNESTTEKKENAMNEERMQTASTETDVSSEPSTVNVLTESKRIGSKQRKADLEEFRKSFMQAPKIDDRKPVFISLTVRNNLDRIVRLFGERGLSVSGLVENLVRNFIENYKEDVEQWRKM